MWLGYLQFISDFPVKAFLCNVFLFVD